MLAGLIALVAGFSQGISFGVSLQRALIATAAFGFATFLGGLVYEKLWLR